jgi:hypothetical protein
VYCCKDIHLLEDFMPSRRGVYLLSRRFLNTPTHIHGNHPEIELHYRLDSLVDHLTETDE